MPRFEGPAEVTWETLPTEERREVYRLYNMEGIAEREREVERNGVWLRQTREVRALRPVEATHEDQLSLEVVR